MNVIDTCFTFITLYMGKIKDVTNKALQIWEI